MIDPVLFGCAGEDCDDDAEFVWIDEDGREAVCPACKDERLEEVFA